jgi:hypothetical protein
MLNITEENAGTPNRFADRSTAEMRDATEIRMRYGNIHAVSAIASLSKPRSANPGRAPSHRGKVSIKAIVAAPVRITSRESTEEYRRRAFDCCPVRWR